jgi:hypothetical protein
LYKEEVYYVSYGTIEKNKSISIPEGFTTPFDPRTHVRLAELGPFKEEVKRLALFENDEEAAVECIYKDDQPIIILTQFGY